MGTGTQYSPTEDNQTVIANYLVDAVRSGVLERNYPFTFLPVTARQTWTTPTYELNVPIIRFETGAGPENAKLIEMCVEEDGINSTAAGFRDPNGLIGTDHPWVASVQWWVDVNTPANLDSLAFVGLEFGTFNTATPPGFGASLVGSTTVYQIRQQLKDPTQWEMIHKLSGTSVRKSFTIPDRNFGDVTAAGTLFSSGYSSGHHVALIWNPYGGIAGASVAGGGSVPGPGATLACMVDGRVRAVSRNAAGLGAFGGTDGVDRPMVGLLVWGGTTQAGAVTIKAYFTAMRVTSFDSHKAGEQNI